MRSTVDASRSMRSTIDASRLMRTTIDASKEEVLLVVIWSDI